MSTNITLFTKNSSLSEGIKQTLNGIAELSVLSEVNESNYPEVTLLDVDTIGISALSRLKEKSFVIVLTEVKLVPNRKRSPSRLYIVTLLI